METISHKMTAIYLTLALALLACPLAITAQTTITFDDLNLVGVNEAIPNGYNGLQWNGIDVENVPALVADGYPDSGYQNGLVSGNNVAFGLSGSTDSIVDSSGSFNLNSAYLTAAWNNGLNLEVLGYVGGVLSYQNSYTLNTTAPSFVNFNYSDLNEVSVFAYGGINNGNPGGGSGTQIVIDNLTISAVPEPASLTFASLGGLASLIAFRRWK